MASYRVQKDSGEIRWTRGCLSQPWTSGWFHENVTVGRRRVRDGGVLCEPVCMQGDLTIDVDDTVEPAMQQRVHSASMDSDSSNDDPAGAETVTNDTYTATTTQSVNERLLRTRCRTSKAPKLNIVILVVGTFGDVLPFIGLGKRLQADGHRVRLASHQMYDEMIRSYGLEYFPLGGDPKQMSAWMVKSQGAIFPRLNREDLLELIPSQVRMLREILLSTYPACVEPDPISREPFTPHAIIANPVSNGHIHLAQALNVPLHLMFPQPWCPTSAYPHPMAQLPYVTTDPFHLAHTGERAEDRSLLSTAPTSTMPARLEMSQTLSEPPLSVVDDGVMLEVDSSDEEQPQQSARSIVSVGPASTVLHTPRNRGFRSVDISLLPRHIQNKVSYSIVDEFLYIGLRQDIDYFRRRVLGLPRLRFGAGAAYMLNQFQVPFVKMWSPSFVPKATDWGEHIDVVGNFYVDQISGNEGGPAYKPPQDLVDWLAYEPDNKPIFIGFGSMVIEDTESLVDMIDKVAKHTGSRVLVQSSWSSLAARVDGEQERRKSRLFMLGHCPHEWLLPQMQAVIHHGGAGTVAAGLRYGKPTFVCPFFGDQHFWGAMVCQAGLGPPPCPIHRLTERVLANAFRVLRMESVRARAEVVQAHIEQEDGVGSGVNAFYKHLPTHDMVCDVSLLLPPVEASSNSSDDLYGGIREHRYEDLVVAEKYHFYTGLRVCQDVHAVIEHRFGPVRFASEYAYVDWDHSESDLFSAPFCWFGAIGILLQESFLGVAAIIVNPIGEVRALIRSGHSSTVTSLCTKSMIACAFGLIRGAMNACWRPVYGAFLLAEKLLVGLWSTVLLAVVFLFTGSRAEATFVRKPLLVSPRQPSNVEDIPEWRREQIISTYPVAQRVKWEWNLVDKERRGFVTIHHAKVLMGRMLLRPPFRKNKDELVFWDLMLLPDWTGLSRQSTSGRPKDEKLGVQWDQLCELLDVYTKNMDGIQQSRLLSRWLSSSEKCVSYIQFCRCYRDAYFSGLFDKGESPLDSMGRQSQLDAPSRVRKGGFMTEPLLSESNFVNKGV